MAGAFSREDGNLETRPIVTSRIVPNSDIDLTFEKKPSGDIFKKTDAAAVKQAVKNLLLTNHGVKPFQPFYGGDLNRFIFQLSSEFDEVEIEERVMSAINNHEPRAAVRTVEANIDDDNNSVEVTVNFQVISTQENVELRVSLTRLR